MVNKLKKLATLLNLLVFVFITSSSAQNTPTNATHLFSISDGISAPLRIAVKPDGNIYITDSKQNNIVVFDQTYSFLKSFYVGLKPTALAVNSSGELFVGDSKTGIIYKLDENDTPTEFSTVTLSASSMVFDENDLLYVADNKLKQVPVID
ncbi:MAG: hypothetical protein C0597_13240 [Marinilabiliales bacterium]|nr:MAG: hypothetical protein C0597_13240 [Marinilabiliales bacterium]